MSTTNPFSRMFGAGSIYEALQPVPRYQPYHDVEQDAYALHDDEHVGEDEVPPSLLFEAGGQHGPPRLGKKVMPPLPSQIMEGDPHILPDEPPTREPIGNPRLGLIDARERALWRWANVENLDIFLQELYFYYLGKGIYSIILSRVLNLLTLLFVLSFSTFLTTCVSYPLIPTSHRLNEVLIPQCLSTMSSTKTTVLWLFGVYWCIKGLQLIGDLPRLKALKEFYEFALEVPDGDLQSIGWAEVTNRLIKLKDANPTTASNLRRRTQPVARMDAHAIANRIMRKENYLIALFNKEVLDIRVPWARGMGMSKGNVLTKALEWNLDLCVLSYVFDEQGQVKELFVKDSHRRLLAEALRRRFIFAGLMNILLAPFIVAYLLLLYFFRYFNEYHKNPSSIGSRKYTPYAQWKFREFNELYHLFQRRINMSYPVASRYIDQFPKDKTAQLSRFVSFVAGSFAAVLALASVIDPELFLGFEITSDRTVLFYIGIFGTILAISRGMIPDETIVYDPEATLKEVIEYTHYLPDEWIGRLHSDEIRREFTKLYDLRVSIFLQEILGVLFTPFILWFSLPKCSERIVDFIREFTVHVDGIGYVCSFAVFDFKRHGNARYGVPTGTQDEHYVSNEGKMEKSFLNFKAANPDWVPDPSGSAFLTRLNETQGTRGPPHRRAVGRGPLSPLGRHAPPMRHHFAEAPVSASDSPQRPMTGRTTGYHPRPEVVEEDEDENEPREHERYTSNLGESYTSTTAPIHREAPKVEDLGVGGGVLGLLAQFYEEGKGQGVHR